MIRNDDWLVGTWEEAIPAFSWGEWGKPWKIAVRIWASYPWIQSTAVVLGQTCLVINKIIINTYTPTFITFQECQNVITITPEFNIVLMPCIPFQGLVICNTKWLRNSGVSSSEKKKIKTIKYTSHKKIPKICGNTSSDSYSETKKVGRENWIVILKFQMSQIQIIFY
jgi:hypothetical protein